MKRSTPLRRTAFKASDPAAKRMVRRAMSTTPNGSSAKAMKEADKWFSMFIRLRDSDEHGIATCITSGRRAFWRTMDCGHYLSRAKMATRYHEQNCHAQSKMSNRFQGGHFMEHAAAIERLHGAGSVERLTIIATQACKRTAGDFQFLADCYRAKVEAIRLAQPERFFGQNDPVQLLST